MYGKYFFNDNHEFVKDEERGTYRILEKKKKQDFSVEELTGMFLTHLRDLATAHLGEKAEDVVITVPPYFSHFERKALLDAAQIARLNVLALITDHAAVALKYGVDNSVEKLKKPQNVLFYDMGSTSTRASIVTFSSIPDKSAGKNKTLPQLHVKAVA